MKLIVKTEENRLIPSTLEESNVVTSVNGQEGTVLLTHLEVGADPLGSSEAVENKLNNDIENLDNSKLDKIDYIQHFRGLFKNIETLNTSVPIGIVGDYAHIDEGVGFDRSCAIWDSDDNKWVLTGGTVASTTDEVAEGSSNLYFRSERVRNTNLTGLVLSNSSEVLPSDSILTSVGKLQAQVSKSSVKWYKASEIGVLRAGLTDSFLVGSETAYWEFAKINGMLWTRGAFRVTSSIAADTNMLTLNNDWKLRAIRLGGINNTTMSNNISNIDTPLTESSIFVYSLGTTLSDTSVAQHIRPKASVSTGPWFIGGGGGTLGVICLGPLLT